MSADVPRSATVIDRVSALEANHAVLNTRIGGVEVGIVGLRADLENKHKENRNSIHELRNGQQTLIDLIHKIDIKLARMAGWACGAGAMVAVIVKVVEHLWK